MTEKAMAPHSSTFAWKIPWMEGPGRLQSMGSPRVGHNSATSLSLFTFMHWRRKWQLAWRIPGTGEPGGLPSMGSHRVGHDWRDLAAAAAEINDTESTTTQNLWAAAKAVLRGEFIAIQSYLKKQEKHRIDNPALHLKRLEKEEQKKTPKERNYKDQSRNKWKSNERNNSKD